MGGGGTINAFFKGHNVSWFVDKTHFRWFLYSLILHVCYIKMNNKNDFKVFLFSWISLSMKTTTIETPRIKRCLQYMYLDTVSKMKAGCLLGGDKYVWRGVIHRHLIAHFIAKINSFSLQSVIVCCCRRRDATHNVHQHARRPDREGGDGEGTTDHARATQDLLQGQHPQDPAERDCQVRGGNSYYGQVRGGNSYYGQVWGGEGTLTKVR
jgi:hypothetical protein